MRLVDERDITWEVVAHDYRVYVCEPGRASLAAYDFEAKNAEAAIATARRQLRPTERMALAAVIDGPDGRGCIWLIGQDPGSVNFAEM